MNIFAIDKNPYVAASHLPKTLIIKMPTESAQMVACYFDYKNYPELIKKNGTPYKTPKRILNHPCTQWLLTDNKNLCWLLDHWYGMLFEYKKISNKIHATYDVYKMVYKYIREFENITIKDPDFFVRAMPDEQKNDKSIDTHKAYREYLKGKWYFDCDIKKASKETQNYWDNN